MKKCIYCGGRATIFLESMDGEDIPMCEFHFRENVKLEEENN
jgi:hypothetical protein